MELHSPILVFKRRFFRTEGDEEGSTRTFMHFAGDVKEPPPELCVNLVAIEEGQKLLTLIARFKRREPPPIRECMERLERPLLIEEVDEIGTTWLVSFGGPNPPPELCVRQTFHSEAERLIGLVEQYAAQERR